MKNFTKKWYYINNPDGGYVFVKFKEMTIKGKNVFLKVLLSENKMMNGVYLIQDYILEKKGTYVLTLKSYDVVMLADAKETFKEYLLENNLITEQEFQMYYGQKNLPEETEEIIFQQ